MTSDRERLAEIIIEYMPGADGAVDSRTIADAILAAGFVRATAWEYGVSIDGGNPEPVWDEYPGDEGRANLEEGGAAKMFRRRKAGQWESFEGVGR